MATDLSQKVATKAQMEAIDAFVLEQIESEGFNPAKALRCTHNGPAVYCGFWGCYADASLYGEWIDLRQADTADKINACIQLLRLAAPARHAHNVEEWMFQDSQDLPNRFRTENPELSELEQYLEDLEEIEEADLPAFEAFCANFHDPQTADDFHEAFAGYWDSVEDYAMEMAEECAGSREEIELMSRWPFNCINWEKAGRELEIGGDIWSTNYINGKGYAIFRNI